MIEKLEIQLLREEEELEKAYEETHQKYLQERKDAYATHPSVYREKLTNPDFFAERDWKESHYGTEEGKKIYWEKDGHYSLTPHGMQRVLNTIDKIVDEVNQLSALVRDASTMAEVSRIGAIANSIKSELSEE